MTSDAHSGILAEITQMITDIVGEEVLLVDEITMDTSLSDDLALESIEFVALAERLQDRHGTGIDLMGLLAGLDIDEIMGLTVGTLVRHIGARRVDA